MVIVVTAIDISCILSSKTGRCQVYRVSNVESYIIYCVCVCFATFTKLNIDCPHSTIWDARWSSESTNFTYKISICDTISNCGSQSSVCRNTSKNHASNTGSKTEQLNITEERKELYLHLTGEKCETDQNKNSKTVINFKCGRTLVIYGLLKFY